MRDRGLLHGLMIGASVLLLFAILLTVANISRYKGQVPPGQGAAPAARPAPAPPAPPAEPAEPAAAPEAPAAEPAAE
jgi:hypothetical protein